MSNSNIEEKDEPVKGWGKLYFISGVLALVSIVTAVLIDIWVGGIIFHLALFGLMGYAFTRG